jgi:hypothetical protein
MGQEKRPFGRYELTSSNNLPSIERGAGQGLVGAASNDLFTAQGFLSHDVGAHLQFDYKLSDLRMLTLIAGAYNGRGESLNDNNNAKSFGFRGTVGITDKLNVGGSIFSHDNIVTPTGAAGPDSSYINTAWGLDAQWGKPGDPGLYVVGDYMSGQDGSGVLVSGDKKKILGISTIGAYNIRIKSPPSWLYAKPAIRYDFADPIPTDYNGTTVITAVPASRMSSRAQFRIAYENEVPLRAPRASVASVGVDGQLLSVQRILRRKHGGSCTGRDPGVRDCLVAVPVSAQKLTGAGATFPIRRQVVRCLQQKTGIQINTSHRLGAKASVSSPREPWTSALPTDR